MLIGITTRMIVENETKKVFVNEAYIRLLKNYGLTPLIIPYNMDNIDELLKMCDGFLLPGGDDIDASYYHEENLESCLLADPRVDALDFKVIRYAFKNNKPVLGICRGFQVVNIALGGTLFVDIKDGNHKNKLDAILNIEEDSFIKDKSFTINSFHHQGIDKLGEDLKIEGRSEEMIELITSNLHPLIASQFHIEQMNGELVNKIMNYYLQLFKKS